MSKQLALACDLELIRKPGIRTEETYLARLKQYILFYLNQHPAQPETENALCGFLLFFMPDSKRLLCVLASV